MKTLKYSRQREIDQSLPDEPEGSSDRRRLYTSIREQFPNISLGTVYRNLNLLVELGEIRKLSCGDGTDHFDYDTSPHYHYVCRQCGRVMDIPMEQPRSWRQPPKNLRRERSMTIPCFSMGYAMSV